MNTAVAEKKPPAEIAPPPPTISETPEEEALRALEKGETSGVFERAELEAAAQRETIERLAKLEPAEAQAAPEEAKAISHEDAATEKELQKALGELREEFADILGETSWRKKGHEMKDEGTAERANKYHALGRSEKRALQQSGGTVTEEIKNLRAEMLEMAKAQRDALAAEATDDDLEQETIRGWEQLISDLGRGNGYEEIQRRSREAWALYDAKAQEASAVKAEDKAAGVSMVRQHIKRLGEEPPELAAAEPIPLVLKKEMPGMAMAETKSPEAWKADAELVGKEWKAAEEDAAAAYEATKSFEINYPEPHSEVEEKYKTYLQTWYGEAVVRKEHERIREERLGLLADISERQQQSDALDGSGERMKGELDAAKAELQNKNRQYDAAMETWNDLQEKQMRKESFTPMEQKKYADVGETIRLLDKERSGLLPLVTRLEQGYGEIVKVQEEGHAFLTQAGNRLAELDGSMEKMRRTLEVMRAKHERSAQEYSTAYAALQEKPAAAAEEEEAETQPETVTEKPYELGVDVASLPVERPYVLQEEEYNPFGRKKEAGTSAKTKPERKSGRITTFLKNRKDVGIGLAALGIFGVKRALNGALDFTDTMFGHAISFLKSPRQFIGKFMSEFDARTKRLGGFSGFASTVSWTLFGGPEEAIEQRETKEQTKQREQTLEEKKRKVLA